MEGRQAPLARRMKCRLVAAGGLGGTRTRIHEVPWMLCRLSYAPHVGVRRGSNPEPSTSLALCR